MLGGKQDTLLWQPTCQNDEIIECHEIRLRNCLQLAAILNAAFCVSSATNRITAFNDYLDYYEGKLEARSVVYFHSTR